jgi:hypothetical protein
VQSLWKAIWKPLKKLKIELPYYTVILLLGKHSQECAPGYDRVTCIPMSIAALFTIARLWKQPRCFMTDEWIKKM